MFDGQILVRYVTNFNRGFKTLVYLYIFIYTAQRKASLGIMNTHKNQRASVSASQ